jgi:hypothetical protein
MNREYAVNDEGITALRALSACLEDNAKSIGNATVVLEDALTSNMHGLGAHSLSISKLINEVKYAHQDACSPIIDLSEKASILADEYQAFIDSDRFVGINNYSSNSTSYIPVNNGSWSGEEGNSMWYPTNETVLNELRYYGNGVEGIMYHEGYPDFTPVQVYESKLNSQMYYRNDEYQFVDCTLELRDFLEDNPDLISYFDDEQLSAIGRGQDRIPGYTWHHDIRDGRMQLVPTLIHKSFPHYGGRHKWGGGSANR